MKENNVCILYYFNLKRRWGLGFFKYKNLKSIFFYWKFISSFIYISLFYVYD